MHYNIDFIFSKYTKITSSYEVIYTKLFQIGINFPKGFVISFHPNFSISKDGINRIVRREASCFFLFIALWARILGTIEAMLYISSVPLMLLIYVPMFIVYLVKTILMCPCQSCDQDSYDHTLKCLQASFMSLIYIVGHLIMLPMQIIVPELNFLVFKTHLWGNILLGFEHEKRDFCGCV